MSGSRNPPVDDGRLLSPPSPIRTQNFSLLTRAHSPSHSSGSHSAGPTLLQPRPLTSLPSTLLLLQYTPGADFAEDGVPSDLPPHSLTNAGARRPRTSLDEGDRTSSGLSNSDLPYACTLSSPLRVSAEYSNENDNAIPFRKGGVRHESLERRAAGAFGAVDLHPSGLYRLYATMEESDSGASTRRPTGAQTPLDRQNRRWSTTNAASPVSVQLLEGHTPFNGTMLASSGDGPDFPLPDVQLNSSLLYDTPHAPPTTRSRNGREEATSFPAFPSPDYSHSPEDAQVRGSIFPSMPEPSKPSLIPGTNLQFEPLTRRSATLPRPSRYSRLPNTGSSYFPTHRPLPSSYPYSPSRYSQGFKGAGGVSSRPIGSPKHPRSSPYLRIPSGAAPPTPPGSIPLMELPMRKSLNSSIDSSRFASPSPPSDKGKDTVHPPEPHVTAASEPDASTDMAVKPETRPVRTVAPSRYTKQVASQPAPEASVQQAKHVLRENAAEASATPHNHQNVNVLGSSDTKAQLKVVVDPTEQTKEDSHRPVAKNLARDGDYAQTTLVQSQSPAVHLATTSRPLKHRVSSQSQPSKSSCPSELSLLPKSSSAPNDGSTLKHRHSRLLHTVAEEKAEYNKISPSSRSQYMNMLLALDDIPTLYDLAASFFTWILLAGFVLFPGTFTSLETFNLGNGFGAALVNRIVNLPLFIVAFTCTSFGIIGMGYLWWKWMKNYIWLVNKIFLPGFMNALAGVISTLVNVYGVQHGEFNTTSIITISVAGGTGLVLGILAAWYGIFLLGIVRRRHVKEMGVEKAGKHGEGSVFWI